MTAKEQEFVERWTRRQAEYDHIGALVSGSTLIGDFLDEFSQLRRATDDEVLTLDRASAESGFSIDHLGRSIREGRIPNAGRPGAPRVRRGDLPRKRGRQNGTLEEASDVRYDVAADVRFLRTIRRGESQ